MADPLLVVPQQAVERQHITVTNERQTVVDRVTWWRVRRYVQEKSVVERGEYTFNLETEDTPSTLTVLVIDSLLCFHTNDPVEQCCC